MRTLLAATAMLAMTASGAEAQRAVRSGPAPMMARPMARPAPMAHAPRVAPVRTSGNWRSGQGWNHGPNPGHGWGGNHPKPPRWGGHVHGRWWGGWRAPGGWGAYRRPIRGFILPSFWISPNWFINDWGSYGLSAPPAGYNWSRYYDDAVLIDGRGSVYDTIGGVNWDGSDDAGADYGYDEGGYADRGDAGPGANYPLPGGDYAPPPPHGAGYPPPPPPHPRAGAPVIVQSPGHYANGYYYPGATVTTVTVTTQPIVTTTTEVYEDRVTYSRPRTVWRKKWHARPKPRCVCS